MIEVELAKIVVSLKKVRSRSRSNYFFRLYVEDFQVIVDIFFVENSVGFEFPTYHGQLRDV